MPTKTKHKPPVLFDPIAGLYPIERRPGLSQFKNGLSATTAYFFDLPKSSAAKPSVHPLRISSGMAAQLAGSGIGAWQRYFAMADLLHRAKQAHGLCGVCVIAMRRQTPSIGSLGSFGTKSWPRTLRAFTESTEAFPFRPAPARNASHAILHEIWSSRCDRVSSFGSFGIWENDPRKPGRRRLATSLTHAHGSEWYCGVCGVNGCGPLDDTTYTYRAVHRYSRNPDPNLYYATPYMTTHLLKLTGVFVTPKISNLTMQSVGASCRRSTKLRGIYHPVRPEEVPPVPAKP
jgi:hypothetical protein